MNKFNLQLFANVMHGNSSINKLVNTADNSQLYGLAGNDILNMTGGSGTLNGGAQILLI